MNNPLRMQFPVISANLNSGSELLQEQINSLILFTPLEQESICRWYTYLSILRENLLIVEKQIASSFQKTREKYNISKSALNYAKLFENQEENTPKDFSEFSLVPEEEIQTQFTDYRNRFIEPLKNRIQQIPNLIIEDINTCLKNYKPTFNLQLMKTGDKHYRLISNSLNKMDSILLLYLFNQKLPSKHDFFLDAESDNCCPTEIEYWYQTELCNQNWFSSGNEEKEFFKNFSEALIPIKNWFPIEIPKFDLFFKVRYCGMGYNEIMLLDENGFYQNDIEQEKISILSGFLIYLQDSGKIYFDANI